MAGHTSLVMPGHTSLAMRCAPLAGAQGLGLTVALYGAEREAVALGQAKESQLGLLVVQGRSAMGFVTSVARPG